MATPRKGAIIRTFSPSDVQRVTGALPALAQPAIQAAFSPAVQYFPAGVPLKPIAPEGATTGRQWDFPSFLNLNYIPRSEGGADSGIDFPTLRRLASPEHGGLDILRLVIETRKDQMSGQRWSLRSKADRNDKGGPKADKIKDWLAYPDGVHTFRAWMRMVMEEHFVLDAVAIFMNGDAKRPIFDLMDGATIKKLIKSDDGRTPQPPLPAYQQIIKGTPAEDYTIDEIAYHVYNPMTNRVYGQSRVAQILVTINQALNRALSQLEYFTSGTTPDGFMELPKEWDLRRIQQWTEWFNSELEGQLGERRKIRFVPQDSKYTATKTEILKDVFDEWIARIVCYAFSLPPQAFIKEMNRATSETAKESAQEEGLEPTKLWFKDVMDNILVRIGAEDLEWYWEDEEIVDPAQKATVAITLFGGAAGTSKPIMTLAEVREMMNLPPATPDQLEELQPPEPEPAPLDASGNADPTQNGNGKDKSPAKKPPAAKPAPDDANTKAATKRAREVWRWNGRRLEKVA